MRYIGLDVHNKSTMIYWYDETTGELCSRGYSVPTPKLVAHIAASDGPKQVAIETSTTGMFIARSFKSCNIDAVAVDAFKTSRLLKALNRAKTDRLDAEGICTCLWRGLLEHAQVWVPDEATHELRQLTRTREKLMKHGTGLRTQIRQLLAGDGEACPHTDLMGDKAQQWLKECRQRLSSTAVICLQAFLGGLQGIAREMKKLDKRIRKLAEAHPVARQLQTIVGCGPLSALTIVAEIGDLSRFPSAGHLRSYAGLVPKVHQSGERTVIGKLDKSRRNVHLRRILILLAQHFARHMGGEDWAIKRRYWRCLYKHGPNPAKVSLGRDLCTIIYAMWRDGTEFNPERLEEGGG